MFVKKTIDKDILSSGFIDSYKKYDENLRVRRLRIGILLGTVFMLFFGLLDLVVYPDFFHELFLVRIYTAVILLFLLAFLQCGKFVEIKVYGILCVVSFFISIDILIFLTEGVYSPYYAGINLAMVILSVLLPWSLLETAIVCFVMITLYLVTVLAHSLVNKINLGMPDLINNLFFLSGTSVICLTSSSLNYKLRFKEFCLNRELEDKNGELSKIDQMKTQFFANISHEFRTPLTLILGPVQDLLYDPNNRLSAPVNNSLNIVKQNGFRLLKLVNDLLDVISLDEGKSKVSLKRINLNEIVGGLVDSMNHMADMKGVELVNNVGRDDVYVDADDNLIEKIILNLLNNAIKFTHKGGEVVVSSEVVEDKLLIKVVDNGIGIKKEHLSGIFDRFKQVDSSDTRKYQGTGLGLSLVKELVELQNATIEVESDIGKGASFTMKFFLSGVKGENISEIEERSSSVINIEQDKISNMHKMAQKSAGVVLEEEDNILENIYDVAEVDKKEETILVVDDEPVMMKFIVGIVKKAGYKVVSASDGEEGVEMAKKHKPDVILFDLMLPKLNGLEACKLLKSDPNLELTKIILLTAKTDETSKITALENGADDFITKPFSSTEVLSRIANLIENRKLQKDLYGSNDELRGALSQLKEAQTQLIHSEKINAIGNLSAGLLHEVNNPLSYSMTAIGFLKTNPLVTGDEMLNDITKDIEEGMTRIKNIVSDLRTFAHPEEVDKQGDFPIYNAIESSIKFTAHDCKDIEIKNNLDPELKVIGSNSHIVQVLVNLISNACKAILRREEGSEQGVIEFRSETFGDRVKIFAKDNGVGMNEDTINKVFNPFFTTNEVGQGVGLGLSISHTIIQNHGGSLVVKSEEGKGTEFVFDLEICK